MPIPATIEQPSRTALSISLAPAQNIIASMMLLVKHDMPGAGPWVTQTLEKLSTQELFNHRLVILGFFFALLPDNNWNSFSEYLDHLEKSDPVLLRDKMLNTYADICINCDEEIKKVDVDWSRVLTSSESYVNFLTQRFGENLVEPDVETKAYEYVIDPPAMQKMIVDYLHWFWDHHMAPEWARVEPILVESTRDFQKTNFDNMSRLEIASYITGKELDENTWDNALTSAEEIVFVPNAHIGPYISKFHCGKFLVIVFGARQPENASIRIPELDRADIVARMSALADDTRLRILQMIAESGELRSQDIIEAVELSQPSISRYLSQLTATGYLQERRVNGSKAYALNRDRIEKTLKAVHKFLLGN